MKSILVVFKPPASKRLTLSSAFKILVLRDLHKFEWTMNELPKDKMNPVIEKDPQLHAGAQWIEWSLLQ